MANKATKSNDKFSPFEKKLLSKVRSIREQLEKSASIDDLHSKLTIRRVKFVLPASTIGSREVKAVRKVLGASQSVFAMFIQVPVRTLQEWEQGRAEVTGAAARLLSEMLADPSYWTKRFRQIIAD